jgi:hypothetical protein
MRRHNTVFFDRVPKINIKKFRKSNEEAKNNKQPDSPVANLPRSSSMMKLLNVAQFQNIFEEAEEEVQLQRSEVEKVLTDKIKEMKDRLQANKLFMNMVIHDLRSPSENIHHGLTQGKDLLNSKVAKIMEKTQEMIFKKIILNSQ